MSPALSGLAGALASFAPTLATMLGGPFAGGAVSALEKAFGLTPGAGADAVSDAIKTGGMTPEIAASIRAADQEYELKMKGLDFDTTKLNEDTASHMLDSDVTDRGSARLRESNVHDNTPKILAYLITFGFFGSLGVLAFVPIQPGAHDVIVGMTGVLGTAWISMVAYYFGSSSGAARSQELLAQSGPIPQNHPITVTAK